MGWDISELENRENIFSDEDLTIESQQSLLIFNILPDQIDGAAIGWYGKNLSELRFFLELMEVYNPKRVFELLLVCIDEYSKYMTKKRKESERKR